MTIARVGIVNIEFIHGLPPRDTNCDLFSKSSAPPRSPNLAPLPFDRAPFAQGRDIGRHDGDHERPQGLFAARQQHRWRAGKTTRA